MVASRRLPNQRNPPMPKPSFQLSLRIAAVLSCVTACGSRTPLPDDVNVADAALAGRCHTCAELQVECGAAEDGCGRTLFCGTCALPQGCGGADVAGAGRCQQTAWCCGGCLVGGAGGGAGGG